jgi:hypothetical protein
MNDVKTLPTPPPTGKGIPKLINPTRAAHGRADLVIRHARVLVPNLLRKNMNLVPLAQMFNQGNRIALGTSPATDKNAMKHGNFQSAFGLRPRFIHVFCLRKRFEA